MTDSKTCSSCKETLPTSSFTRRRKALQPNCRECNKKKSKAYYSANKETMKPQIYTLRKNRVSLFRAEVASVKTEFGCCVCGEREPCVLDFHHVTDDKEDSISRMIAHCISVVRLNEELSKCVVICSNCHRKHHAGLLPLPTEHLGRVSLPESLLETSRRRRP